MSLLGRRMMGGQRLPTPAMVGSITNPAFNNSSGAQVMNVPKPSGVAAGDLLIIVLRLRSGGVSSITDPSGFTSIHALINVNEGGMAWWKIADGSEGSTIALSLTKTSSGHANAHMIAIRNVRYHSYTRWNGAGTTNNNVPDPYSLGGGRQSMIINWSSKNDDEQYPTLNTGGNAGSFSSFGTWGLAGNPFSLAIQYVLKPKSLPTNLTGGGKTNASANETTNYMFTLKNILTP